ncbi:MAG TPA: hypothetical protein VJ625_17135 [Propionibacteriaceae bacterium]|nr:hypothetical protein [Propionibacteriaceae bacterium]
MVFVDRPIQAAIEFEASGLRVSCTTSTLAARIAVERFEQRTRAGKPIRQKDIGRLAVVFVAHVAWWNIRRESGALVPVTPDGVLSLDVDDTLEPLLRQWVAIVASPPASNPAEPAADIASDEAPVDETATFLDQLEARTLTEPGEDEQLVTDIDPVLEPA